MGESMFTPSTQRIADIYKQQPHGVEQLRVLLNGRTKVYIDYANVRPWSNKLKWHVHPKRLFQFYKSFGNITEVALYQGVLNGDSKSEYEAREFKRIGYTFRTKPVKIMKHSIDASSIPSDSTDLIAQFIRKTFLRQLDIGTVEFLNGKLYELNTKGKYYLEDRKCNFDVEIGSDMMIDSQQRDTEVYCLWSGDSDFADVVKQLLEANKKVVLFATSRRVSAELNELRTDGLFIFDIAKIRNYICWPKEITIKGI